MHEVTTMLYAGGEKQRKQQNVTTEQRRKTQPRCHQHNDDSPLWAISTTLMLLSLPPTATRTTMPRE